MTVITHFSTSHVRSELRVHLKECNSLVETGYVVHYVVADGQGDDVIDKVIVHDVGRSGGRLGRLIVRPWKMLLAVRRISSEIYHFHDPELLAIALFLPNKSKVIYDSHEDVPRSLLGRVWIPKQLRSTVSKVFEKFENFVVKRLDAVVGATPHISERFQLIHNLVETVNNYPLRREVDLEPVKRIPSKNICYVGGISRSRGILEIINALESVDARLILAGPFDSEQTERLARSLPGWEKVDYHGVVSRSEVRAIMASSQAGLVFFQPEPNHINSQPNKMFEYMAAGLPVLASDFPLWHELLEDSGAGYVANPIDSAEIAKVINLILDDATKAQAMGAAGRELVTTRYMWEFEAVKLLRLYDSLLERQAVGT